MSDFLCKTDDVNVLRTECLGWNGYYLWNRSQRPEIGLGVYVVWQILLFLSDCRRGADFVLDSAVFRSFWSCMLILKPIISMAGLEYQLIITILFREIFNHDFLGCFFFDFFFYISISLHLFIRLWLLISKQSSIVVFKKIIYIVL